MKSFKLTKGFLKSCGIDSDRAGFACTPIRAKTAREAKRKIRKILLANKIGELVETRGMPCCD
tara:strand:+ start:625 stop:813 length:189 start_codon:yes stop_codon:yes gene_type:complete